MGLGLDLLDGPLRDLLQVQDVTQIEAQGMTPTQLEELKQYLARNGLNNAKVTHPTTTLEDLFVRVVRDNTPSGQSSVGSSPS